MGNVLHSAENAVVVNEINEEISLFDCLVNKINRSDFVESHLQSMRDILRRGVDNKSQRHIKHILAPLIEWQGVFEIESDI